MAIRRYGIFCATFVALLVIGSATRCTAQKEAGFGGGYPLQLGAAWYPEQWPESRWDTDLALMESAHLHFVRIGEFAWSRMEPSEGHYDLDWLNRAVRLCEKHHIQVVLGTPTAAPPAWLTEKYPDVLRVREDGTRFEHGGRGQYDFTSPRYREFARQITSKLAARFGHDPNVIGWQIDNELGGVSFSSGAQKSFQLWLKHHYRSLDNLNRKWTTNYWSQTYSAWGQISIPKKGGNPGLLLSWKRFISDTYRDYQKNQLDVIRGASDKRQFITSNMMGWFDGYDHYTVSQDLDMASWDDYVHDGHLDAMTNGARHDLTRGLLQKNFWVMEMQPGHTMGHGIGNELSPGEVRAMAWHAIGHGAEGIGFWQWRSALNGQEQYYGTLIGADGRPVPLYDEVARLGVEFEKLGSLVEHTTPRADVAILHSYESRWAIDWQRQNKEFDPIQALMSYYVPLMRTTHSVDIVAPSADLSQYKLVVAPGLNLLKQSEAQHLIAYVRNGGHLVLGARSGLKDCDDALQTTRQPGPLAPILGAYVEQFYSLEKPARLSGEWGTGESKIWGERLKVTDPRAKVLMRFGAANGWLDNEPAVVTRKEGAGSITYIGAWLDNDSMDHAVRWMLSESAVKPIEIPLPAGVELTVRKSAERSVWILVNLSGARQIIDLPSVMKDAITDTAVSHLPLDKYGVAVLEPPAAISDEAGETGVQVGR